MRKKELMQQLAARDERIVRLEQQINTMDGLIDGYHSREQAIVSALTHAHETAAAVVAEAEKRAAEITAEAEREAARRLQAADQQAGEQLEKARRQSAQLLSQAEATVAEYDTIIQAYNAELDRAAAEASATAERFAAFSRERRIAPSGLSAEAQGLHELPYAEPVELPDAGDSPAQLMQNIYRIQNRVPPEPNDLEPLFGPSVRAKEPAGRETEPAAEAEPDEAKTPTLGDLLPNERLNAQVQSLDELLEEIIRAGEQK